MTEIRSKGLIAAGGNLPTSKGTPAQAIVEAIKLLHGLRISVRAVSRFYQTPCFPPGAGPDYVNVALTIETGLDAPDLLAALHRIEAQFGRERAQRWGMRTLDLDLVALDDLVLPDRDHVQGWIDLPPAQQINQTPDRLILPHPRMQDRAFVLVPLMDIAPDWRHPLTGRSVAQMHADLPAADRAAVTAL